MPRRRHTAAHRRSTAKYSHAHVDARAEDILRGMPPAATPAATLLAALLLLVLTLYGLGRVLLARSAHRPQERGGGHRVSEGPLLLAAAAVAALAALLVQQVLAAPGLAALDGRINLLLEPCRAPWLVRGFAWFTGIGSTAALLAVSAVATGFLLALARDRLVLPLWLSIAGAELTTWTAKFVIDRPRPDFLAKVTALSPSFPSAHATGAIAVYGFIAYVLAREPRSAGHRFALGYWSAVLVLLIAFSRVFLSVHYASDVLGGLLVGGCWLLLGIALAMRRTGDGR